MYKEVVRPTLDFLDTHGILDSEDAHNLVKRGLNLAESHPVTLSLLEEFFAHKGVRFTDPKLKVTVGGIELDNPLMVGGGWDKEGVAVKALHKLGFAAVTVGTVTEHPQPGNPKKRQFILSPGVALNRLGFNSSGMQVVDHNLKRYQGSGIPIGISLGKNKDASTSDAPRAHAAMTQKLYHHATYFEVNVSSPNTPGLRELQDKGPLTDIVQAVNQVMGAAGGKKPLFVKIAPDLTLQAIDDVIRVVLDNGLAGIVATNTTNNPQLKAKYGECWRDEMGGLSGDDEKFRQMSDKIIAHIYRQAGQNLDIIGVGGVRDGWTALRKIMAGAKAVQIVTGLRGEGLTLPGKINRNLVNWISLRTDIKNINDCVGVAAYQPTLQP